MVRPEAAALLRLPVSGGLIASHCDPETTCSLPSLHLACALATLTHSHTSILALMSAADCSRKGADHQGSQGSCNRARRAEREADQRRAAHTTVRAAARGAPDRDAASRALDQLRSDGRSHPKAARHRMARGAACKPQVGLLLLDRPSACVSARAPLVE